jgi:hypothetical protein
MSRSDLKQPSPWFGVSFGLALCVAGWTAGHLSGSTTLMLILASGGLLFGLLYSVLPRWRPGLFAGVQAASFPVRFAATFLVLAVVYYAVMTPIALWFRLSGKSLRRSDRASSSNWQRCQADDDPQRYLRTF